MLVYYLQPEVRDEESLHASVIFLTPFFLVQTLEAFSFRQFVGSAVVLGLLQIVNWFILIDCITPMTLSITTSRARRKGISQTPPSVNPE